MRGAGLLRPERWRLAVVSIVLLVVSACAGSGSTRADQNVPAAEVAAEAGDAPTSSLAPATTSRTDPPFDEMARSAAPKGRATALLTGVQTGRHDGFERIVFGFAGEDPPGYQVEWMDGPVAAAGSGSVVHVAGTSRLRIVLNPASGVDLATGDISYEGPNRLDLPADGSTVLDVVRSGDFEAVMTWVAGTDAVVPFRVLTLSEPTRVVVDVAVSPAR